jgi:hypothetical protein
MREKIAQMYFRFRVNLAADIRDSYAKTGQWAEFQYWEMRRKYWLSRLH